MNIKSIKVVAAVIRKDNYVFATQRGYGEYKDWWEFPGGKLKQGKRLRRKDANELLLNATVKESN